MKGQFHHIEIWVSDLAKTIHFWGWILEYLGYLKHQEWKNGISWKLGKTYIAFEQTDKKYQDVPYNRMRIGLNHLAFHLDSQKQLKRLVNLLKQKKIPLLYQDQQKYEYTGKNKVVHIEDPEGFELEFVVK